MILFSEFLSESTSAKSLSGTHGPGHRYFEKYIASHWDDDLLKKHWGKKATEAPAITLHKDFQGHPEGSPIFPIKDSTKEQGDSGKKSYTTKFRVGDAKKGKIVEIPHNYIRKPESANIGNYVDENAVIRMGNHAMQNHKGKEFSIQDLHDQIEKAKTDPNHPLHHLNAPDEEFKGKKRNEKSEESYYSQLKDASHTIHALSQHPDFADHFKNGDIMEGSGRIRAELSDLYTKEGVKGQGATSKADVITIRSKDPNKKGIKLLSLKQEKGSQLMSSSPAEFSAVYKHAFNQLRDKGEIDDASHAAAHAHIDKIKQHLENEDLENSKSSLDKLHKKYGKTNLIPEINKEALTGIGKFKTEEGTATHVATIGKGAHVERIEDFLDKYHKDLKTPIVTSGKRSTVYNPPTVRLLAPTPTVARKKELSSYKPAWMTSGQDNQPKTAKTVHSVKGTEKVPQTGSAMQSMDRPGIRTSPSGWPEHMHQAHTDGTHGGMTF